MLATSARVLGLVPRVCAGAIEVTSTTSPAQNANFFGRFIVFFSGLFLSRSFIVCPLVEFVTLSQNISCTSTVLEAPENRETSRRQYEVAVHISKFAK